MKYRLLGSTGLYVSEMCLGTMTFGKQGFWSIMGGLQQKDVNLLVQTAFDEGINFIDTANVYSFGESESYLGQAIKDTKIPRDQLIVATKSTAIMDETPNGRGQSRFHIFNQVDASLKRLQLDHIDLYQVHGFDPLTPLEESLCALNDVVRSGKVRYIGLCNMAAWQIMKALGISRAKNYSEFISVQAFYTIASRDLEREVFPLLNDQKLGLMVWSPLAGGFLSGKYQRNTNSPEGARRAGEFNFPPINKDHAYTCIEAMTPIAKAHGVTIARVALAWTLAKKEVSSVIIGAKTKDQLLDNVEASSLVLSQDEISHLDNISALPKEYPAWMIDMQATFRATPAVKTK